MKLFVFFVVLMAISGNFAADNPCKKCDWSGQPVCGKDGKDYINECRLNCKGIEKDHDGECYHPANECKKHCDHNSEPVCGKDGQIYPNECYAKCYGTEKEKKGQCKYKKH